jgi:hypothetical protein
MSICLLIGSAPNREQRKINETNKRKRKRTTVKEGSSRLLEQITDLDTCQCTVPTYHTFYSACRRLLSSAHDSRVPTQ